MLRFAAGLSRRPAGLSSQRAFRNLSGWALPEGEESRDSEFGAGLLRERSGLSLVVSLSVESESRGMNHSHSILKPGGWSFAVLVVICTLAAWLNSLDGDFLMDDFPEILDNPSMESPWQPLKAMFVGNELIARSRI